MRDEVVPKEVTVSMDIDSVIWLTRRLKVKGAFNLFTSPHRKEAPPISRSNHLFVELLWPPLEEDLEAGHISGAVKRVPISNLPNTHFATFGRVAGSPYIIVVFPRMKHRYPLRGFWETKLPYEVELGWLTNVVYEAMGRVKGEGTKPYRDYTYEDAKWKHAGVQEVTQAMSAKELDELQDHMHAILEEHEGDESYDCFRSFFFVLEMRGVKTVTSSDNFWVDDPWKLLTTGYPGLDWDYMEDSKNGELLIDVGFGFHAKGDVPLVGFWKTDALQLSFDYGGYAHGVSHSTCTIPSIGGMTAEMAKARRLRVHVAYRQSYNLTYETVRGKAAREKDGFLTARSAYHQKDDYRTNVTGITNVCTRSCDRSYGVRDEYRCRAATVRRLFRFMEQKVSRRRMHQWKGRLNS